MSSAGDEPGSDYIDAVIKSIIGRAYLWQMPDEPPTLGPDYRVMSTKLRTEFQSFLSSARGHLSLLSHDELVGDFDSEGKALSSKAGSWQSRMQQEFKVSYLNLPDIFAACLGKINLIADTDAWSKMAFFNLDEAVWLSVGLEPEKFTQTIAEKPRQNAPDIPPVQYMRRRHEQFKREFNPHGYERQFEPAAILAWINRVNLEVHSTYRSMLERRVRVYNPTAKLSEQRDQAPAISLTEKPDKREVTSLSLLLLAMAIDHYGYDPKASRSKVPKEIQDMMATLGLELSQDTILRYLRTGAQHLPPDWKPIP